VIYLIDTDWVIEFLVGRPDAGRLFSQLLPAGAAISIITYMETVEGIRGSRDPVTSWIAFRGLMQAIDLLGMTEAVAERAADIRLNLRQQKRQVHERALDIIVAATALEHGLTLITGNTRHYQDIPGLVIFPQT
jgi:predicted nucleic acid-binding protein